MCTFTSKQFLRLHCGHHEKVFQGRAKCALFHTCQTPHMVTVETSDEDGFCHDCVKSHAGVDDIEQSLRHGLNL